jgi:hypothetical protein
MQHVLCDVCLHAQCPWAAAHLDHVGASFILRQRYVDALLESTPHSRVQLPGDVGGPCRCEQAAQHTRVVKQHSTHVW